MAPKLPLALLLVISLLLLGLWLPAGAAPAAQVQYATPTPGADGRILYTIQAGDTCIRIAVLNGISVEQLRELNKNIDPQCSNLIVGQPVLIGLVGPAATPTAGPSPTPLPPTITPTPPIGTTEICVMLFDDLNGDALRQETEPAIPGGAISVTETNGAYSASQVTVINADPEAYQGMCFTDVPEGNYNISVAIPDNYNPTMELAYKLDVKAGDRAFIDFGAQSNKETVTDAGPGEEQGSGRSVLLGILGGILLLGGGGLGWYAWRMNRPAGRLGRGSALLKRFKK
ncbi:MAG: LysM peptidoglycan-binding domain-containing protein [Bacteroidota bacterium]